MSNTVGNIAEIRTGKLDVNAENVDGKYPFFTCSKEHTYIDEFAFDGESVLVAGNGDLNVKYYNGKFNAYQRTYVIQPKPSVDGKYLYYFLETYLSKLREQAIGGVIKYIKLRNLTEAKIPLPPLPVQKRIAEILDLADAYRQKTKALIDKYDELAQSIFLEMFGDPVTNPKGWDKKSVSEISHLTTKGESPKWQGFEYIDQGVRFITSENVRMGYLNVDKDKFVHPNFHLKLKRSQLKENDLLVNLVGASIGRGALVSDEMLPANINQAVAKTELDSKKVHPKFVLEQIINPRVQDELVGNRVEGARANISLKNVRELSLIVPPVSYQTKFVQQIHSIEMQKEQVQTGLKRTENLFNSLLQRAFKGELVRSEDVESELEKVSHA